MRSGSSRTSTGTRAAMISSRNTSRIERATPLQTLYDLARGAVLREGDIGAHDVTHVEEIPLRVEVSDVEQRFGPVSYRRELPREIRNDEPVALTGTDVVERASDDGVYSERPRFAKHDHLRRGLTRRIRICRCKRRAFASSGNACGGWAPYTSAELTKSSRGVRPASAP